MTSASNCLDYQSRRLGIRYRSRPPPIETNHSEDSGANRPKGRPGFSPHYVHTLNATAAAIPRLIVALTENGVQYDGSGKVVGVRLPEALRPFWLGQGDDTGIEFADQRPKAMEV